MKKNQFKISLVKVFSCLILAALSTSFSVQTTQAQRRENGTIDKSMPPAKDRILRRSWNATPAPQKVSEELQKEPAVILFDLRRIEFIDAPQNEIEVFKTLHRRVKLQEDRGIEAFNKIYLPFGAENELITLKARTILPNGSVKDLDTKNIKEIKEEGRTYKIFAFEGLAPNSEIEYLYIYKTTSNFFGREMLQGSFPVLQSHVEIITPERLQFDLKAYNKEVNPTDSVHDRKRFHRITMTDLPGAEEEKYAMRTANLGRIEYKLSYNKSNSTSSRLFTWNDLAKRAYSIYSNFEAKDLKRIESIVKSEKWADIPKVADRVMALEHYLKKNFSSDDDFSHPNAEDLEFILKNKRTNERGMVRLFSAFLTKLEVAHEIVLCGSREDFTLDQDLENWINCENTLISITSTGKFISPNEVDYRYPWVNPMWAGSQGIFCKSTTIGDFKTAIAQFKDIELEPYQNSYSNIETKASLNKGMDSLNLEVKQSFAGYNANFYRAAFNFAQEEQKTEISKELIKSVTGSEHIQSRSFKNVGFENYNKNEPFIIESQVKSTNLVEKAGNNILVKFGLLIGEQAEMYQEKKRLLPVELAFPHVFKRQLSFEIPEGYRIKNVEDIKMNEQVTDAEGVSFGFVSNYEIKGNTLIVEIEEIYRDLKYSLDQFNIFKKVINTSADFNKVTLVLEKI